HRGMHLPWYCARKDLEANTLWAVQGHDHPWLQYGSLHANDASWVAGAPPDADVFAAKTRYRQTDAPCGLVLAPQGPNGRFSLRFPEPQWAVTPGQSAVLYDGDVCLGGGVIVSAENVRITPASLAALNPA
ncbi:MAG: aminomethyltransferase beta-barrel domain-containing protein, partial [Burkholderiaceae bacterium]